MSSCVSSKIGTVRPSSLKNDNTQGEYYLTDIPEIMRDGGGMVGLFRRDLGDEIIGVNTVEQLALVEGVLSRR